MKPFAITAFICFSTILIYGQQSIRWNENKQLTWEDFTGKVNDSSKFDAECFAEIRYEYRFFYPGVFQFDVYANFDRNNSWSRKEMQTPALLKHEQMHFNIAQLFAEKLRDDFENFNYSANYNDQIRLLFIRREQEYRQMQEQYDEETNHSLRTVKQKEWEDFIFGELRKTKLDLQFVETDQIGLKEGI
jgi:hypothetical protein